MAQSFSKVYLHFVFATKYRQKLISPAMEKLLYPYIAGIIKNYGGMPIAINGMPDHIHILSTLPRTLSIAEFMQEIKRCSSKWIKQQDPAYSSFTWQGGYAAFSVNPYNKERLVKYIQNQKTHHSKQDFKGEFVGLLDKHKIEYQEKYLWD